MNLRFLGVNQKNEHNEWNICPCSGKEHRKRVLLWQISPRWGNRTCSWGDNKWNDEGNELMFFHGKIWYLRYLIWNSHETEFSSSFCCLIEWRGLKWLFLWNTIIKMPIFDINIFENGGFMMKRNNHIIRVLMDINHNIKYIILLIVVYKRWLFIFYSLICYYEWNRKTISSKFPKSIYFKYNFCHISYNSKSNTRILQEILCYWSIVFSFTCHFPFLWCILLYLYL